MVEPKADAGWVLVEYRGLFAEHWSPTRCEDSFRLILRDVDRHLNEVDIDMSEVSGGVPPAVVDRVITLALDRHRQRAALPTPKGRWHRLVLTKGLIDGWLVRLIEGAP